jgi:hypothetical protein
VTFPWLSAERVRVDDRGAVVAEALTFSSAGPHLIVVGAPAALASAIAGLAPVARGTLRLRGLSPAAALAAGDVAFAPLDPRLPEAWRGRAYVEWSARLSGASNASARASAQAALAAFELAALADGAIKAMPTAARRALVLAAALATGASTLVLCDPTKALPDAAADTLARIAARALSDVAWVLMTGRVSLASALIRAADDALLVSPDGALAQGPPASVLGGDRHWIVRAEGSCEAFVDRLRASGAEVSPCGASMALTLPEGASTHALFVMAEETNATIVSLCSAPNLARPGNAREPASLESAGAPLLRPPPA